MASPEAYATLMFVPALIADARLYSDASLAADWLNNTRAIPPLLTSWWGCTNRYPLVRARAVDLQSDTPRQRGLFFTGGVDSTHALLQYQHDVDVLVFVHGFDIDIDDRLRADAFELSLRELAAETGKQVIVVRTNARKHELFGRYNWEQTHGAALAAVGHLLAGRLDRVLISGSWSYADPQPWGSRWDLDSLWSGGQMQIEHADATLSRQQKIAVIAAEPISQQYLRVCWENLSPTGNCCRCAKCLRTMLSLKAHGVLDKYATFEPDVNLVERLDALPGLSASLHGRAREQLGELAAYPELQAALTRLLERKPV